MTTEPERPESVLTALAGDASYQSAVAQVRARAVVRELTGVAPDYDWTYVAPRLLRNSVSALLDLERVSRSSVSRLDSYSDLALRVARMWESMALLEEGTTRSSALLNSALAYELAGYQANATCLARQLSSNSPAISLAAFFMQRYFLRLRDYADELTQEPMVDGNIEESLWHRAAVALLARGLTASSHYFLSGDEDSYERGRQLLARSERGFVSLGAVIEANLVSMLTSLLHPMKNRSTWEWLRPALPDNPRWVRYLKILARGPASDVYRSASVSELWTSQRHAIRQGLLEFRGSKVIRMPTSAGKTRVAELAMMHAVIGEPGAKCIYVAPYRALVNEVEQSLYHVFSDMGLSVSSILGAYESDAFEQLIMADSDVLVLTPEKLDLVFRLKPEDLEAVKVVILDEGQLVDDPGRGVKFELLLTRLKRRLPEARFLFLSAMFSDETLEDLAAWFSAGNRGIITSQWRPSVQRVAKFEWRGDTGVLRYAPSEDTALLEEFIPGVIRQQRYEYTNPETMRINRPRFPEKGNKAQVAAELAYKFSALGPVLVFAAQIRSVHAVGKAIEERLRLAHMTGESTPAHFLAAETHSAALAAEWLGPDHLVTRLLRKGIAVHHGNLPDAVRQAIESDFRNRNFRVLVATNTLAQGVNLAIRTVVVHSCWWHTRDTHERVPARHYWNIAGRAGRAREETEGTVIHIALDSGDNRDYEYYLQYRHHLEPIRSALVQMLEGLATQRLSEGALIEKLDPEILALLVENEMSEVDDAALQQFLDETLTAVQATRFGIDTDVMLGLLRQTAEAIFDAVPDGETRKLYSTTGLSTRSSLAMRLHIEERVDAIRHVFTQATEDDLDELCEIFLEGCTLVEEMKPDREFAGSKLDLLRQWVRGAEISELREQFGAQAENAEDLTRFMEDFFSYRMSWGISSYIRIAKAVLNLDDDAVSNLVKFFAAMVKFGVPVPEAAWAMTIIPIRRVAIALASTYLSSGRASSMADFREWLASKDSEELERDYGLRGRVLEEAAASVRRIVSNRLAREMPPLEDTLREPVPIAGIRYSNRRRVAMLARPGMRLRIGRDYDNPVDRNAIAIRLGDQMLGYLPRDLAQFLGPEIDAGLSLGATVTSVDRRRDMPKVTVTLTSE